MAVSGVCPECGAGFTGHGKRKYCSDRCRWKRDRRIQGSVVRREYGRNQERKRRENPSVQVCCAVCEKPLLKARNRARNRVCSYECRTVLRTRVYPPKLPKTCIVCGDEYSTTTGRKTCGDYCAKVSQTDAASIHPLRRALNLGYLPFIEQELLKLVVVQDDCWIWQGQATKKRSDKSSYPLFVKRPLHRWIVEAKHDAPLGDQAAHHVCGNSLCVRPSHLVPVTHAENMAEMLARKAYVSRIAELELALMVIEPNHPLLQQIPLAGVVHA